MALIGLAAIFMVIRSFGSRNPGHHRMALPALVKASGWSRASLSRHGALMLALAGLPFFIISLADPRTALTRSETTFPGRRIALLIDASSSMLSALPSTTLAKGAPNNAAFFTTVGAARYFIERRMAGKYRDLMALDRVRRRCLRDHAVHDRLREHPAEHGADRRLERVHGVPRSGHGRRAGGRAGGRACSTRSTISMPSGNLMVIFTDGADADVLENGKTVDDVLAEAQKAKIPVYLIKIGGNIQNKRSVADELWIGAVKKTGGEFFSGGDEATIIRAIQAIDRRAAGKIEMKQYSTERPRYAPFAMTAALLWCAALLLRFTIPTFQTFP